MSEVGVRRRTSAESHATTGSLNEQEDDRETLRPSKQEFKNRSRSPSPAGFRQSYTPSPPFRGRSPTPIRRSPSPCRGFPDTITDLVDLVKHETTARRGKIKTKYRGEGQASPLRGRSPIRTRRRNASPGSRGWRDKSPEHRNMCLQRRCRSPSRTPVPSESYGTVRTERRSRSPSPASAHSLPLQRRPRGRKLPQTPNKPSTLRFDVRSMERINFPLVSRSPTVLQQNRFPGSINFPKVNASPTRMPETQVQRMWRERTPQCKGPTSPSLTRNVRTGSSASLPHFYHKHTHRSGREYAPTLPYNETRHLGLHRLKETLSFETAATYGRGSRQLPSPLPNGHKPGQKGREKHRSREEPYDTKRTGRLAPPSDSEDDWC